MNLFLVVIIAGVILLAAVYSKSDSGGSDGPPPTTGQGQSGRWTHVPDYSHLSTSYRYPTHESSRLEQGYYRSVDERNSHSPPSSTREGQNGHRTHIPGYSYPSTLYTYPVQDLTRVQQAHHHPSDGRDSNGPPPSTGKGQSDHRTHIPDYSYPSALYTYSVQDPTHVQQSYHRPADVRDSHGSPPSAGEGQSDHQTHIPDSSFPSASYTYPVQNPTHVQQAYHCPVDVLKPSDQPVQREYQSATCAKQRFKLQKNYVEFSSAIVEHRIDSKDLPAGQSLEHQIDLAEDSSQDDDTEQDWSVLRARAKQEGDMMSQCYQQSQDAFQRGEHARAKVFSAQGGRHKLKMESLNNSASAQIFKANNPKDGKTGRVDLHNLFVKEALLYAKKAIEEAPEQSRSQIQFVVGKGLHSEGNEAKIKPALEKFLKDCNIQAALDPNNAGVLIARL